MSAQDRRAQRLANIAAHKFRPGQSGNPGGTGFTSARRRMRELARDNSEAGLKMLVEIMQSTAEKTADRIRAAEIIFERGFGKPGTEAEVASDESLADMTDADLAAIGLEEARRLLGHTTKGEA